MKRTIDLEGDNIESSTETENLIESTPRRMADHKIENSSSVSPTAEEVARQIRAATDPSRNN